MADADTQTQTFDIFGDDEHIIALSTFETVHGDTTNYVFHYTGPLSLLESLAPNKGALWAGGGIGPFENYLVVSSTVTRHECEMGEMTVTCGVYELGDNTPVTERYEVQFAETSQPLAFHPNFPAKSKVNGNDEDNGNIAIWQKFLSSGESVQLELKYLDNPAEGTSAMPLPQALEPWAKLYNKGIQNYMVYLPVIMRIGTYELNPGGLVSGVGMLGEPQGDGVPIPNGYEGNDHWLKTGDNFSQEAGTGKWTRTETWTYAHEWPTTLYGSNTVDED